MRHRDRHSRLNRKSAHNTALRRNMAQNLIEHGKLTTTLPKAKNIKAYFEKLVTVSIRIRQCAAKGDDAGALRARRVLHRMLTDRAIIPKEHRRAYEMMSDAEREKTLRMASGRRYRTGDARGKLAFTAESVTRRLIEKVAPKFEGRKGGYTRVIRLGETRIGDNAPLAMVQFVGDEEAPKSLTKPARSARRRRADARYALAAKLGKTTAKK